MTIDVQYSIGDKLHVICYSDFAYEVEVEITGIVSSVKATLVEDVLRKLWNIENQEEKITEVTADTLFYYTCKVLKDSKDYTANQEIILCDAMINIPQTYYLKEKFTLRVELEFDTETSNFKKKSELISAIKAYLDGENVTHSVSDQKTPEELTLETIHEYQILLSKFQGLKPAEDIVDKLLDFDVSPIHDELTTSLDLLNTTVTQMVSDIESLRSDVTDLQP